MVGWMRSWLWKTYSKRKKYRAWLVKAQLNMVATCKTQQKSTRCLHSSMQVSSRSVRQVRLQALMANFQILTSNQPKSLTISRKNKRQPQFWRTLKANGTCLNGNINKNSCHSKPLLCQNKKSLWIISQVWCRDKRRKIRRWSRI